MKKHLQLILAMLCILALAFGINAALAEEETESRIIQIRWEDGDNIDGLRPTGTINAWLDGKKAELNAGNGWSGEVVVPASTQNSDWTLDLDSVEHYACVKVPGSITVAKLVYTPVIREPVTASIDWDDDNNRKGIRPDTVTLALYADGQPCAKPQAGSVAVSWDNMPTVHPDNNQQINYSVKLLQVPEGYTATYSGTTVKLSLNTVNLTLKLSVSGAPEGIDINNIALIVDGPDPSMPRTLTYGETGSAVVINDLLPGAYLIRDINAAYLADQYNAALEAQETDEKKTYYVMDTANCHVCDAVYIDSGEGTLTWKFTYKEAEDYGATLEEMNNYNPEANLSSLEFRILGPDPRMPVTVKLENFDKDGGVYKYSDSILDNLTPGVYTVVELNAETLVKYYTLTSNSKTAVKLVVTAGEDNTATARLFDQYAPAVTPEPDAEFVDIPVTKTWNDNNNKDKNRPGDITVRLYADGVEVDSHVITAAEGWKYTFTEKHRYQDDNRTEIVYSVNEDEVKMYAKEINGYNLVNHYQGRTKELTVVKVWKDNNNAQGTRPTSIYMTLNINGEKYKTVELNSENGWSATVKDVPAVVDGKEPEYSWTEHAVIGYVLTGATEQGNTMTFTNTLWETPDEPPKGGKGKTRGKKTVPLEDYDTPLGVEVIINHVGDCFD
ncbi:MAG: Cna B-type domain-containing protein [Clostridia bacterium]|nr:Cna B-type domain-containing protein [Clostridia bacterium]